MRRALLLSRTTPSLLAFVLLLAGCSGGHIASGGSVDVAQALERQHAGGVLLDVRTAAEYQQGHAVDARLVPWVEGRGRLNPDFFDQVARIATPDQEVLVICQTGNRSAHAAHALQQRGYHRAVNVLGGSMAWRSEGLPWEGAR
ncbi:MAG: rhodanese-like domain-containing protein [Nitrospirota bacterium]|jgi:rhodanese-related sulfurtransferase